MTVRLESMRFLVIGLPARSTSKALPVPSPDTNLDAEARRLAAGVAGGDEPAVVLEGRQELDRHEPHLREQLAGALAVA